MDRSRRALLAAAGPAALALAGCLDPFPDPPPGTVVLTNRDDAAHRLTLAAGDRRRRLTLEVGAQVVVTNLLGDRSTLRVRLDERQERAFEVDPDARVHLVVTESGRLRLTDGGR